MRGIKPSIEELEDKRDRLEIEEEVVTKETSIAEKKAVISQLKQRYGRNWKGILGAGGSLSLVDLRNLLVQSKKGMRSSMYTGGGSSHPLNPLPPRR